MTVPPPTTVGTSSKLNTGGGEDTCHSSVCARHGFAGASGPCRQLGPTIDKIAAQYNGKVKVGKLNVDDSPDVATKYGVNSIPRVFFFKGGDKPTKTIVGLVSENELVKTIDGLLT